jgi:hypothetical protein
LITFNAVKWAGDYAAVGVSAIEMDLKAFDAPLDMRVALKTGNGFTPGYVTNSVTVPNDGAWHHVVFQLDAGNLTAVNGPPDLATLLGAVGELRILHASAASLNGEPITATVGIDNVGAVAVPEPASLGVLGLGAVGLLRRRLRR